MTISTDVSATDRYVSFSGIDCEGNTARLLARVFHHIDDPLKSNAFWDKFRAEVAAAEDIHARKFDGLCLVCARVGIIAELFEQYDDTEGLALLEQIENECC
ncbi:N(2)-fixation sustaining protein CowN [Caenispirillum bisanense]|uniref:N(2)-fixation sustaining protein CowN n=1 Tax=Caenispirillum bisanense TaxID=414052 RepID=UPI0031D177B5